MNQNQNPITVRLDEKRHIRKLLRVAKRKRDGCVRVLKKYRGALKLQIKREARKALRDWERIVQALEEAL
ncbi:MAG: hypothetical protein GTN76_07180 [Candidatus Aenigmarchaeota archaeon]|nr:hypothetical protein [Candidatus Aenigmarchaeota archaeon]